MPELFSQVLDLKEKDVFLETEVNDTRYFSVTGIPSTLSYGKHPFSITFKGRLGALICHLIGYQSPGPFLRLALLVTSLMLIKSSDINGVRKRKINRTTS